ncbi:MAG: amidohydrolase family protein, partial [Peptococcaceae bacterium]|nr:amidohydrolase family protein [Peptococcaceae bacterium]
IIHCQTVRDDQLEKMKELSLYPSFFPAHIYVWGDRHTNNFLGQERASRISPCASALNRGLRISLHNDEPVTKAKPLGLVWNAVSRTTSSGKVLGAEQAISVYDALKAVTIDSAWQYHLEDKLGSLAAGKKADFIVLAQNPLTCAVDEIPHILIEQTWVDGKQVWSK